MGARDMWDIHVWYSNVSLSKTYLPSPPCLPASTLWNRLYPRSSNRKVSYCGSIMCKTLYITLYTGMHQCIVRGFSNRHNVLFVIPPGRRSLILLCSVIVGRELSDRHIFIHCSARKWSSKKKRNIDRNTTLLSAFQGVLCAPSGTKEATAMEK